MTSEIVYLDHAATTPLDERVLEAMLPYLRQEFGNAGSRTHEFGSRANAAIEEARSNVGAIVDADPSEVIFTSGATEANNLALLGLADHGVATGRNHIISTSIEHKAVLEPLEFMSRSGFTIELCPVDKSGWVKAEHILDRVRPETLLVSVMHANNETGILQPIGEIAEQLVDDEVFLHVDAAQTFGKARTELTNKRIDLISASAHKVYGPKGIGALITRRRNRRRPPITPRQFGGGQERRLRPGTQPVHQCVGFGAAARLAGSEAQTRVVACEEKRVQLLDALNAVGAETIGDQGHALPHIVGVRIPGVDAEALMLACRDVIAISNGSACTSTSYEPSHVLTAMGFPNEEAMEATRWSWSANTSLPDNDTLTNALETLL